jgi:hypothetical protein
MTNTPTPRTPKKLPRVCKILYLLTAVSAVLYFVFTQSPAFSDWFNRYISRFGRQLLAYLFAWLPFSFAELIILLLPLMLTVLVVIGCKRYCATNRDALVYIGILLSCICVIGIIFVWNFAPGYYGTTLDKKLELERRKSSADDLYQTAEFLRQEIDLLEKEIIFLPDGSSVMPYSYQEMNAKLLSAYESFCAQHDFVSTFYSRVKPVMLSEPMSYTHITGVYTFFTGEANINVNFPDYTIPFTAAHELAHQRGIAREDEANFVAFLVCMESNDAYIRYSAYLNMYEYVASALYSANKDLYKENYLKLPKKIINERIAYSKFFDKYRENVAAEVTGTVNNAYLTIQGTPGTKSYGMVVDLAVAYYRAK